MSGNSHVGISGRRRWLRRAYWAIEGGSSQGMATYAFHWTLETAGRGSLGQSKKLVGLLGQLQEVKGLLGQLQEDQLGSHVPGRPQGVLVCGGEPREGHGPAVVGAHDPLRQQEVAEEGGHHQVLRVSLGHHEGARIPRMPWPEGCHLRIAWLGPVCSASRGLPEETPAAHPCCCLGLLRSDGC